MSQITLKKDGNIITLDYFTQDEVAALPRDDEKNFFEILFRHAEFISDTLDVKLPDLAISSSIRCINPLDGSISNQGGITFFPDDYNDLNNIIINLSVEDSDMVLICGTLAHEMRHIYQKKKMPELVKKYASGYLEALNNPAEIDADAFAIKYLMKTQMMTLNQAATIICPDEKKHYPAAYRKRIERAKKLELGKDEYQQSDLFSNKKQNKITDLLRSFLKKN